MKKLIFRLFFVCAFVFAASVIANAQRSENAGVTLWRETGKTAVLAVGSASKATWSVTKFAVKAGAKPVAKTVFTRVAPSAGKFALKKSAEHLLPVVVKLAAL